MIKRLSFKVSLNPDIYSVSAYIQGEIEVHLQSSNISEEDVINIIETEKDSIYSIIIYYKK